MKRAITDWIAAYKAWEHVRRYARWGRYSLGRGRAIREGRKGLWHRVSRDPLSPVVWEVQIGQSRVEVRIQESGQGLALLDLARQSETYIKAQALRVHDRIEYRGRTCAVRRKYQDGSIHLETVSFPPYTKIFYLVSPRALFL